MSKVPAVWFPTIRAGSGSDVFTIRLAEGLRQRGIRAEITWLPHRAEYLPWSVKVPSPPEWANVVHVNSVMHQRFVPRHLPVIATIHSNVHDPALSPYKSIAQSLYHRLWIKPAERRSLSRADCVVAVSHYTAARVKEVFGERSIAVIHNGVPIDNQPFLVRTPHTPFRLLYVGNWSRRKGVDLLAPIMSALGDEFELWFTGDSRGGAQAGMPKNCRCIGRVSPQDMASVYRQVDALIFPTRLEGYGLVAAEAISHAVPVVASKNSSLPEVVKEGVDAVLCETDDVASFVSGARKVMSGWATYRVGCRRSRDRLSIDRMIDEYVERYSSII